MLLLLRLPKGVQIAHLELINFVIFWEFLKLSLLPAAAVAAAAAAAACFLKYFIASFA